MLRRRRNNPAPPSTKKSNIHGQLKWKNGKRQSDDTSDEADSKDDEEESDKGKGTFAQVNMSANEKAPIVSQMTSRQKGKRTKLKREQHGRQQGRE